MLSSISVFRARYRSGREQQRNLNKTLENCVVKTQASKQQLARQKIEFIKSKLLEKWRRARRAGQWQEQRTRKPQRQHAGRRAGGASSPPAERCRCRGNVRWDFALSFASSSRLRGRDAPEEPRASLRVLACPLSLRVGIEVCVEHPLQLLPVYGLGEHLIGSCLTECTHIFV